MKIKSMLAVGSTLLLAAGLVSLGVTTASASPNTDSNSNHANYWEDAPSETCTKLPEVTPKQTTFTLGAPASGLVFSKVIIKSGSTGTPSLPEGMDENTVYKTGLTEGAVFDHESGKNISHVIVCTVPAPVLPPTVAECATIGNGGVSTNLNANGWTFDETRTSGHNVYVPDGLHVYTDSNTSLDKAAGYHALSIPLKDVGAPSITLENTSGVLPSIQLGVDRDGNGTWDGYLVNEGDIYGHGNWWTSKAGFGVPAGGGYASLGSLNEYLVANPSARIVNFGYSLGSGVKGDAVIKQITVGCNSYTFDRVQPATITTHTEWTDGFQSCKAGTVKQNRDTSTTTFTLVDDVWVAGEPVVTQEKQLRPMTSAELDTCAGDAPQTKVVYGEWTDTTQDCDALVVDQTRTVTTTTYVLVDHEWVGTDAVTTENKTRGMTADELSVCAGPQPKAEVTVSSTSTTDCAARTVSTTETTSTVAYVLDTETNTWVKDKPVVTEKTTVLPATAEECPIPAVVPPTTTPQAQAATPEVLASTGASQSTGWFALGAFGLLLLGGGALILGRRRKATE